MNDVAKAVSKSEGLKVELPIGQIKETLRCLKDLVRSDEVAYLAVLKYFKPKG
jgi:hypothetical protein